MEPNTIPPWHFASDDHATRYVVVTDVHADLGGWSIHYNHVDGTPDSSAFERTDTTWSAPIEAAALLDSFETAGGQVLPVDPWDAMVAWLIESMTDMPPGSIIDVGPNTDVPEDIELATAQIHVLREGVFMLRRSSRILRQLRLLDHSVAGLQLDQWHHDELFDDCTDGYLFSRDLPLVAHACASWLRDAAGVDALDELGCSFEFADELPRTAG